MSCNFYKSWQIRATKSSRLNFIFCTYKVIAFFAECCLHYFIERAAKTPVLERSINASNDKRSLAIKSMFSTTSCMCDLSSLKIHLFFLNERWYKLWLKIALTCFSNTRFTCKIISALYIWHIKAGKVVLLRPKLETFLAPVSYRLSRRCRQRKRLLLKVPNDSWELKQACF